MGQEDIEQQERCCFCQRTDGYAYDIGKAVEGANDIAADKRGHDDGDREQGYHAVDNGHGE